MKKIIFSYILFLISGLSIAQTKRTDSLNQILNITKNDIIKVNTLNALAFDLEQTQNAAKAMVYVEQAEELAEKINYAAGLEEALLRKECNLALLLKWEDDVKTSLRLIGIKEKRNAPDTAIFLQYEHLFNACFNLNNFPILMEYVLKGKKLAEKRDKKKKIMEYAYLQAVVYDRMNDRPKAKEYFLKWIDLVKASGNRKQLGPAYMIIADIAASEKNNKLALDYCFKSLRVFEYYDSLALVIRYTTDTLYNHNQFKPYLAQVYSRIAETYKAEGNYKTALDYSIKCLVMGDTATGTDVFTFPQYLIGSGDLYMKMKNYPKAYELFVKALNISKRIKNNPDILNSYNYLAQLCYKKGDYKVAYDYFQSYSLLKDSLNSVEKNKQVVELNTKYETEKKDNEIALLGKEQEKQSALAAANSKRQRVIILSVSIGLIVVLIFSFFIFKSYRQKQKANIEITGQKKIIEEKQKEILDSIHYAKRIQVALITSEKYIDKNLNKLIS